MIRSTAAILAATLLSVAGAVRVTGNRNRMRRALVPLLAVSAAIAALGGSAAASSAACGSETIGGATVRTWCGPAQATVKVAGKTIAIKGGECSVQKLAGLTLFSVNVGRYTVPRAKPKFTSFSAAGSNLKPGTYDGFDWAINVQTPGKQWTVRSSKSIVTILAPGAKKGRFTGAVYEGGKVVSGSWTC